MLFCVSWLGQALQTEMWWLARHSMRHLVLSDRNLLILEGSIIILSDEWELRF